MNLCRQREDLLRGSINIPVVSTDGCEVIYTSLQSWIPYTKHEKYPEIVSVSLHDKTFQIDIDDLDFKDEL